MKRSVAARAELERIERFCRAVITEKKEYWGVESPVFDAFEDSVRAAVEGGNVRGLRMMATDLREDLSDLPPTAIRAALLAEAVAIGLASRLTARVERAVARGCIASVVEYEAVSNEAERVGSTNISSPRLKTLNQLMADYHRRKTARGRG